MQSQPNNQLRTSLGLVIADGRLHPDASRDLFIFLDCYEFQDFPVLEDCLVQALSHFHKTAQNKRMATSCPYISGKDQFPAAWLQKVASIAGCLSCYFCAGDQIVIAQLLGGKK